MANMHIVTIIRKPGVSSEQVETALNQATDWYRYRQDHWVVISNWNSEYLSSLLQPFVEPTGQLFICKLNPWDRFGWVNKEFWDWFDSRRNNL